jgi:hypothetical protein
VTPITAPLTAAPSPTIVTPVAIPMIEGEGIPKKLADVIAKLPTTTPVPKRTSRRGNLDLVTPPAMQDLPAAFADERLWENLPTLRARAGVVGYELGSTTSLAYDSIEGFAYPSANRGGLLDDTSINAYIALMREKLGETPASGRNRFFDVHDVQAIMLPREDSGDLPTLDDLFVDAGEWRGLHNVVMSDYDSLIFVVNVHANHYVTFVFYPATSTLLLMDSIYQDVMDEEYATLVAGIQRYIQLLNNAVGGGLTTPISFIRAGHDVPQQDNGRDCGIFTLLYALHEAMGEPMNFGPEHIVYYRRRMVMDLLTRRIQGVAVDSAPVVEHPTLADVVQAESAVDEPKIEHPATREVDAADLMADVTQALDGLDIDADEHEADSVDKLKNEEDDLEENVDIPVTAETNVPQTLTSTPI